MAAEHDKKHIENNYFAPVKQYRNIMFCLLPRQQGWVGNLKFHAQGVGLTSTGTYTSQDCVRQNFTPIGH